MNTSDDSGIPWGPTGQVVFDRTYSRTKEDGTKENWFETVDRVVMGNLALVYGDPETWNNEVNAEYAGLVRYMDKFAIIPAGRHLWSSGVTDFLANCFTSGWGSRLSDHFEFTFLRLMEGGGVGATYSGKYTQKFGAPKRPVDLRMYINASHQDFEETHAAGALGSGNGKMVEDSREGWAEALCHLINYAMSPGSYRSDNVLRFDVSGVRPSGAELKTFGGTASGPAPFVRMMHTVAEILNKAYDSQNLGALDLMEIDHAISECVVSGGNRRSARMSMLHWKDPQIFEFINCKQDTGKHWTTNISVIIDDEFTEALNHFGDEAFWGDKWLADRVHKAAVKAVLDNGEPGYWNESLNAKGETGAVYSCNPCSEITLEPWESCLLGHVNLDWFHDKPWDHLEEAHRLMTRFLIRATFAGMADPKQREIVSKNRRIGVGHLGVQGFWAKKGVKYSNIPYTAPSELRRLYQSVREAAREYSFELRIPEPVKVTTVAPTGSVAKLPGVSEGIHPIYSKWYDRRVRFSLRDPAQADTVLEAQAEGFTVETDSYDASGQTAIVVYPTEDILVGQVRELGINESVVQSADELTLTEMLEVQACYQENWADNAVSYTCNIPEGKYDADTVADILADYLPRLKGTTLMVDASRPQSPYTRISKETYEAAVAKTQEDSTDLDCASGACPIK